MDPRVLLINWLRSKNFHARDIAVAMHWYDKQCETGVIPNDNLVYGVAERSHRAAVEASKGQIPEIELSVKYKIQAKVVAVSISSGFIGSLIFSSIYYREEIYQWLSALTP